MKSPIRKMLMSGLALLGCLLTATPAHAEKYALIYSGGGTRYSNASYFGEQTLRVWRLLVNRWGYAADNVYVLFADGTDPALDYVAGIKQADTDWSEVVRAGGRIGSATKSDFLEAARRIGERMEPGRDSLFFWSFDHGGQADFPMPGQGSLTTWYSDFLLASEMSALVQPITAKDPVWEAYVFNQCYSEEMANGLGITSKDTHRFAAWAAAWYETSTQAGYADAWLDGMAAGLVRTRALGNYANGHDPYGPNGQAFEHPGWRGGDFSLTDPPEPANASPALPGVLAARKASQSGDFLYETGDAGMIITGYTGRGGNVAIPATIQGRAVTELGTRAFQRCTNLTSVTLPKKLTTIGGFAFRGCTGLTNVTIPEGVARIVVQAFDGCSGLTEVAIPGSVTSLMVPAFSGCTRLTAITVSSNNTNLRSIDGVLFRSNGKFLLEYPHGKLGSYRVPDGVTVIMGASFAGSAGLTEVIIPEGTTNLLTSAFTGCAQLTSVTLPNTVTDIGDNAFSGCASLTAVALPGSVVRFGNQVFRDCAALTNLAIPEVVTTLGERFLSGCASLVSVTIPPGVTSMGDDAFYGCASLASIAIPKAVTNIGTLAFFGCASLKQVTIPANVKEVGLGAFYDCTGLTNVTLPNTLSRIAGMTFKGCASLTTAPIPAGVTRLGDDAFRGCASLTQVTIPNRVTDLGRGAFAGCAGLKSITIPEGITNVGDETFSDCAGLASVTLPQGVARLGIRTFSGCSNLASITIPESVTDLGHYAFEDCVRLTGVTLPGGVASIGRGVFSGCARLTAIAVAPSGAAYGGQDGVLFSLDPGALLGFPGGRGGSYQIPAGVTQIGDYAFCGCAQLTDVTIPQGVTTIGDRAFQGCTGLTNLTLPDSVTRIGYNAFHGCAGLTRVTLPSRIARLGDGAFSDCLGLTSFTIPVGVTRLGGATFFGCSNLAGVYFEGPAPTTGIPNVFQGAGHLTVYYRAGGAGWGTNFAGCPTALWAGDPYSEWAKATGLLDQYPAACGETDDPDHDGASNLWEMLAGTEPTHPNSVLAMEIAPRPGDLAEADKTPVGEAQRALYFQSVPGRTYAIQSADRLDGSWQTETTVTATTTQKRALVAQPATQAFYRVLVVP